MMRRIIAAIGPYELQPAPLGAIMSMFYLIYSLGVYNERYINDSALNLRGALPALIVGIGIGFLAAGFRRLQYRQGVTWRNYLLPLFAISFLVPTLRALLDFLPQLPAGTQAYPATVLRSFIVLVFVSAVLGSVNSRLTRRARETEEALSLAREQQIRLITADEEARRQVAVLLHDRVQAGLIASCLELQALAGDLGPDAAQRLEPMISRLEQIRSFDVRGAARVLSPNLEDIDLQTALEELALQYEATLVIDIEVDPALDLDRTILGSGLPLAAYRIVEQGLLNAAMHSGGSRVEIRLVRTPRGCLVRVADDGVGISADVGSGLGTTVVTTWSRAMQGEWHWESGIDGRGTSLVAVLEAVELNA
ncbi:MAG: hypothetical protein RL205_440 [Actinomycetota bacterium]